MREASGPSGTSSQPRHNLAALRRAPPKTNNDTLGPLLILVQNLVQVRTPIGRSKSWQKFAVAFQPGKFDLIILDYEMPDTKGDKLAAAIKALAPGQPILMITAYSETLRLAGIFPLSVNSVMSKPFDIREFREKVRQMGAKT